MCFKCQGFDHKSDKCEKEQACVKCSGTWFMTFLNAILIKFYSILRNTLKIKDYFILSGQISKVVIELYSLEV